MDALNALRECIITGSTIREEKGVLNLGRGRRFALTTKTPFRGVSGHHSLGSLWLQYEYRDRSFAEFRRAAEERGVGYVLVHEKRAVLDFLTGQTADAPLDHAIGNAGDAAAPSAAGEEESKTAVDSGAASGSGRAAGATEGASERKQDEAEHPHAVLERVRRREIPLETRLSVLDAFDKRDMRSIVFAHFGGKMGTREESIEAAHRAGKRARPSAQGSTRPSKRAKPMGPTGTPIIIVPSAASSMLNMYNAPTFFEEGKYISVQEGRRRLGTDPKPSKTTITHKDSQGVQRRFHVVDNVLGFRRNDWAKVVAVFVHGPAWQFKGWRWGRDDDKPDISPVEIFDRSAYRCYGDDRRAVTRTGPSFMLRNDVEWILLLAALGFHLHYDDEEVATNVGRWRVTPLGISKSRRHLDSGVGRIFWEMVETFIDTKKPSLRPASSSEGDSSAASDG